MQARLTAGAVQQRQHQDMKVFEDNRACNTSTHLSSVNGLACVDSAFRALGLFSSTTAVGPCCVTSMAASGTAAPAAAAE
jgi:hypothetical protein